MYYFDVEYDWCGAGDCAGAASFSLLELEPQPDPNPYVKISNFEQKNLHKLIVHCAMYTWVVDPDSMTLWIWIHWFCGSGSVSESGSTTLVYSIFEIRKFIHMDAASIFINFWIFNIPYTRVVDPDPWWIRIGSGLNDFVDPDSLIMWFWIRIRIRIDLNCWIQIHIRIRIEQIRIHYPVIQCTI
jgi:hypothetical protein